jgi:hypothetical protein
MRVGGTTNFPTPKKRAQGRTSAVPCEIEDMNETRYCLSDFEDIKTSLPRKEVADVQCPTDPILKASDHGVLSRLPDWAMGIFESGKANGERSDALYSLACALVKLRCDDAAMWRILWNADRDNKYKGRSDEKVRFAELIAKARQNVNGDVQPEREKLKPIACLDTRDAKIPPIEWIAEGWVMRGDVSILAGAGGTGKSTAAMDFAVHLAKGLDWCGIRITRAYKVLFIDEEQGARETLRLALRLDAGTATNLFIASEQGIDLSDIDQVDRLREFIITNGIEIVIFDSAQQVFGIENENDAPEVGRIFKRLFALREELGTTFLIVHHRPKKQGFNRDLIDLVRGSSAFVTQASTVWLADTTGDVMELRMAKRRGAEKLGLRITYSNEGENERIHLAGEPLEESSTGLGRASEWVLEYVTNHGECRPKELKEAGKPMGFIDRTIGRALVHLQKLGSVEKRGHGVYGITKRNNTVQEYPGV